MKPLICIVLLVTPAIAQQPSMGRDGLQMGFYCGHAGMYPYGDVYCPQDDCLGDCRGVFMFNSKSAPLPESEKFCVWADINNSDVKHNWYQWMPRAVQAARQKYLGPRLCFLEDRGNPKDINDFER